MNKKLLLILPMFLLSSCAHTLPAHVYTASHLFAYFYDNCYKKNPEQYPQFRIIDVFTGVTSHEEMLYDGEVMFRYTSTNEETSEDASASFIYNCFKDTCQVQGIIGEEVFSFEFDVASVLCQSKSDLKIYLSLDSNIYHCTSDIKPSQELWNSCYPVISEDIYDNAAEPVIETLTKLKKYIFPA